MTSRAATSPSTRWRRRSVAWRSAAVLRRAQHLGVLAPVIPETVAMRGVSQPKPHRFDVLEHSLRAVSGADRLAAAIRRLAPWGETLAAHLAEPLGGGVTRRETL